MSRPIRLLPTVVLCANAGCTTLPSEPASPPASPPAATTSVASVTTDSAIRRAPLAMPSPSAPAPLPGVIAAFPHDIQSFTEGLVYEHGVLFESTGLYGESRLRKIDLTSGRVLAQIRLTDAYFGEGLALLRGELYQLTYKEGRCFVYDAATLEKKREMTYEGEGWGLTTDGAHLVMSDGSSTLAFRDPRTFEVVRKLTVTGGAGPVTNVNELEWVRGFILANVWGTDLILRLDPATGRVVQTMDLAYLPEPRRGATIDDVLNGIAYDQAGDRLFVTGKRWSHVFQIPTP